MKYRGGLTCCQIFSKSLLGLCSEPDHKCTDWHAIVTFVTLAGVWPVEFSIRLLIDPLSAHQLRHTSLGHFSLHYIHLLLAPLCLLRGQTSRRLAWGFCWNALLSTASPTTSVYHFTSDRSHSMSEHFPLWQDNGLALHSTCYFNRQRVGGDFSCSHGTLQNEARANIMWFQRATRQKPSFVIFCYTLWPLAFAKSAK